MKKLKLVTTIICLFAFSSFTVKAALVTEWGFEINSGFVNYDPSGSVDPSNTNALWNAPSTLTWGTSTGSGRSSLDVGGATNGYFAGNMFTNGAAVNTVSVTHTNNPVTGTSLNTASLADHIRLTPLTPVGTGFDVPSLLFNINFIETTNTAPCAANSPVPCNDIFVLDIVGAGFNPANNTLNQNFLYGGDSYNARLFIDGLGLLTDSECAAASVASGCIGFTTVENQINTFQVALDITTETFEVPETGTLAIFLVGLLSLLVSKRKA
ncbi:MAG: THxN family PEP-CTERM protein [Cognaticolwellia aestuarii]